MRLEDIDIAVNLLAKNIDEELISLLKCFGHNYIGRNCNGSERRNARFPQEIWNLCSRVLIFEQKNY